jgi:hypothetical protein
MTNRELRTPPLRPDADPERSADYAAQLANARSNKEFVRIHRDFADLRVQRSLRQEISDLLHAPKGSEVAKARDKLGFGLILFGLFGVSILVFAVLLVGGAIVALF